MLIPYGTARRRRRFPWVTTSIIALNLVVYLYGMTLGDADFVEFARKWGFTGAHWRDAPTLFTMSWIHDPRSPLHQHLIGNMWALLVFGPQVEDALGAWVYGLYYLVGGAVACLAHLGITALSQTGVPMPVIGASGAVLCILGIFAVRFYSTPVNTVFLVVPGVRLPAVIFLAIYLGIDIRAGIIETFAYRTPGGVAHWAHIGGFLFGAVAGILHGVVGQARREYLLEREVQSEADRIERIGALRCLLGRDPEDAEAHLRLATLLDADERTLGVAARHYQHALRLLLNESQDERALSALASMQEGRHSTADLEPDLALGVAGALERAQRLEEALGIYLEVAQRPQYSEPILEQALIRVASISLESGRDDLARWALGRLLVEIPFTPCSVWAQSNLRRLEASSRSLRGDRLGGPDLQAP